MHHKGSRGPYAPLESSRLAALRVAAGLTQAELGSRAGLSERSVRQHEFEDYGTRRFMWTHQKLMAICSAEVARLKAEAQARL